MSNTDYYAVMPCSVSYLAFSIGDTDINVNGILFLSQGKKTRRQLVFKKSKMFVVSCP